MDSLFANYAASDDEEDQPSPQPPTQLLSNFPAPTRSLPLSSSSLFPSLPPPKSSSLFQSLPKPKQSSNPTNEELEDSNSINSSSIFSSLPRPKGNPPNPSNSLANPLIDPTELASILPQPKRVVLFKPPVNPSSLNLSEEDDDDDEEEAERRRRKGSESSFQTPSVTSFLSSIPAPKNSATLGILPSSGSGRRSILETGVPVSLKDSGLTQNVDNRSANYDSSVNYSSGVDQNVDNHRESNDNSVNDDSGAGQYGWNYENYDGYGNYQYAGDQNVVGEAQSGSISSNTEYVSYENYGNYGDYGQYGTNPAGPSEIVNDGTYVIAENSVRIPEKRRRNEVPTEILEVKQDELIKNRPREDQVKLTGIAFGPSYQPASTKGKPSKLHKRKHQINSLFFDMKQKEMELAERRSRGLLTKAETQAKYGW